MLHCVDHNHLKQRPLYEVFPPIQTFNQVQFRSNYPKVRSFSQVSHCTATRRIAVGTKQGSMVMYELRASRVQHIPAHQVLLVSVIWFNCLLVTFRPLLPPLHLTQTARIWSLTLPTRTNCPSGKQGMTHQSLKLMFYSFLSARACLGWVRQ